MPKYNKELNRDFWIKQGYHFTASGVKWKKKPTGRPPGKFKSAEERFWLFVNKNGPYPKRRHLGRCWLWTGAPLGRSHHGQFSIRDEETKRHKAVYAHRFSFEFHFGPIPDGKIVGHRCDVTMCVRPTHLEAITSQQNCLDAWRRVRTSGAQNS